MKMRNKRDLKTTKRTRTAASDDIPDKLPVKSFSSMTKNRSFVFYGRSGTGKTTLAASFPRKVLILDIKDRGTDSLSDIPPSQGVCMPINDWDDFEMVYYYLKKHPEEYGTIALDTVSQLQTLCIKKYLSSIKKDASRAGDWGTMTKKDWGEVAAIMKEWIINYRDLIDLGMEVVFIAQDRTFNMNDDDGDDESMLDPEVGPALSPSIAKCLNAAVNIIGNTFIRKKYVRKENKNGKKVEVLKKDYCLRIGPNPIYITKARKPKDIVLGDYIVNATYDKIIDLLQGE